MYWEGIDSEEMIMMDCFWQCNQWNVIVVSFVVALTRALRKSVNYCYKHALLCGHPAISSVSWCRYINRICYLHITIAIYACITFVWWNSTMNVPHTDKCIEFYYKYCSCWKSIFQKNVLYIVSSCSLMLITMVLIVNFQVGILKDDNTNSRWSSL